MSVDVVVVGGGPAGAIAALVLVRAGARVTIFDRARFPRHKLCGDSVNPGAMSLLGRLGVGAAAGEHPIRGMIVTGEGGVRIDGRYPGVAGRAVLRRDLDHALLNAAAAAGARVEEGVLVRGVVTSGTCVEGVEISGGAGASVHVSSRIVIAADGRQSQLARSLGMGAVPAQPRRWAVGGYFTDVHHLTDCGEMHIRRDRYIGVAPLANGLANLCVVTADRSAIRDGAGLLRATIAREPELSDRFATARLVGPPVILGPLALECRAAGMPGLLLAGDAAGFIDPMTGDGLRFAIRGAELAAREALGALEHGIADAHRRLLRARRREFRAKWRFNRALRVLAGSPSAVRLAAGAAALVPSWVERSILYAGDVGIARPVQA